MESLIPQVLGTLFVAHFLRSGFTLGIITYHLFEVVCWLEQLVFQLTVVAPSLGLIYGKIWLPRCRSGNCPRLTSARLIFIMDYCHYLNENIHDKLLIFSLCVDFFSCIYELLFASTTPLAVI